MAKSILVLCGLGGVGKTTVSAAAALGAAHDGLKSIVVTMDPARRLATALGVGAKELSQSSDAIDLSSVAQTTGSFSAMMPDTKSAFIGLLDSLSTSPDFTEKVSKSRLFKIFSEEFSGANSYMALERLLFLHEQKKYDRIILDTPPSHHLEHFLEAPHVLLKVLSDEWIQWIVKPSGYLVAGGVKKTLGALESLTGSSFVKELFEFFTSLVEVRLSFSAKLETIDSLLKSNQVAFVPVFSPLNTEARFVAPFCQQLIRSGYQIKGAIINRSFAKLESKTPYLASLKGREAALVDALSAAQIPLLGPIEEFARDIHDIKDLNHVAKSETIRSLNR